MAKNFSRKPKRGFEPAQVTEGFVRKGFRLAPCTGEAHGNPHIDNCGVCFGETWGWVTRPVLTETQLLVIHAAELARDNADFASKLDPSAARQLRGALLNIANAIRCSNDNEDYEVYVQTACEFLNGSR